MHLYSETCECDVTDVNISVFMHTYTHTHMNAVVLLVPFQTPIVMGRSIGVLVEWEVLTERRELHLMEQEMARTGQ